jgi:hypothetical protein
MEMEGFKKTLATLMEEDEGHGSHDYDDEAYGEADDDKKATMMD